MTKPEIIAPFAPLPWQVVPWRDKSSVILLTGHAGGGKSRLAAEKIHGYCLKYPGSAWLMLRKAREWTGRSVVAFYKQSVVGNDPHVRFNKSEGTFYYDNGSIVYAGGMMDDKQREAVRSIGGEGGLDGVWFEEASAFSRKDFEEIIGRVRHTAADWQQILLSTNPDAPTHWINTDLIIGGGAVVYYSGAKDNPYNSPAYLANLEKLTGVLRDRLVLGLWKQAEGAVYEEFEPAIHVIDPFPIPATWRRFRVVDFGFTNPFTCQWWAMDDDGRLYEYREIYQTRRLVEDVTPEIIRLSEGEHIEATIADHDAEDRATMEKHGIITRAAIKDVSPGIQAVKMRMKVQPDGKPRIFFMRGALVSPDPLLEEVKAPTCLLDELPGYAWQKTPDGRPNKEQPVKLNDHGCDDMRYLVVYIDGRVPASGLVGWA